MTTTVHIRKDWRELPAGRELDRVVIDMLGVAIQREADAEGDGIHFIISIGDAWIVRLFHKKNLTDRQVIEQLLHNFMLHSPHWSTDTNAAAQLWEAPHKPQFHIEFYNRDGEVWHGLISALLGQHVDEFTGTLADVLTRCWIAAKEQEMG